jgi:hypothetical protein
MSPAPGVQFQIMLNLVKPVLDPALIFAKYANE